MANRKPPPAPPPSSPFAVLADLRLPPGPADQPAATDIAAKAVKPVKDRGRLDVLRSTAHRGGKTVTVIKGFEAIATTEIEQITKQLQKACGAGGTVKNRQIEIQGDQRKTVLRILREAGFRPVLDGG
jgi:translation initiation factor 1